MAFPEGSSLLDLQLLLKRSPGDFKSLSNLLNDETTGDFVSIGSLLFSLAMFSEFVSVVDSDDLLELLETQPDASLIDESEDSSSLFLLEFFNTISLTFAIPSSSALGPMLFNLLVAFSGKVSFSARVSRGDQ